MDGFRRTLLMIDEEAVLVALRSRPQDDEGGFDTVADCIAMTDEENLTVMRCAITAYLTALEAKGYVIVPRFKKIQSATVRPAEDEMGMPY